MKRTVKRSVLSALTTLGAAISLTLVTSPQAHAIDMVECGPSDFLTVNWHIEYGGSWSTEKSCFANAGEFDMDVMGTEWLDSISTGNNRVQWWGDGRWQPDTPIGKNTVYTFPNHPGGVALDWIRIL
ncbi:MULTISPECIES: beta/gamma crystallin domain-containing protein [unclassified Streptomyces]|uniref:beta/gamma crystallin domain-containing protein n=1 Tax=unclassified Streptomyces TaxID=2593676 RepID=UPI0011E6C16E|nr:beta/gamma crystallin domain-containing protein [Streptomyces sp. sk2.1]TXS64247.1 hypothetical protein EAO76_39705 [Streptomyces sp. sk2.1]